jgi:type VI protein secretion system component Hcp
VLLAHVDKDTVDPVIAFRLKDVVLSSIAINAANMEHPVEMVTMSYKGHEWTFVKAGTVKK